MYQYSNRGSFYRTRAAVKRIYQKLDDQAARLTLLRRYRLSHDRGECTARDIKRKVWDATPKELAFMLGKGSATWDPTLRGSA